MGGDALRRRRGTTRCTGDSSLFSLQFPSSLSSPRDRRHTLIARCTVCSYRMSIAMA